MSGSSFSSGEASSRQQDWAGTGGPGRGDGPGPFVVSPSPPSAGPGLHSYSLAGPKGSPGLPWMELSAGGCREERLLPGQTSVSQEPSDLGWEREGSTCPSLTVPSTLAFHTPSPTLSWPHV